MKALQILSICLLASIFTACSNDRGPENDPSIKIETNYQPSGMRTHQIVHKSCTFEAVVIEDELENENRIKVLSPWGEKFWVYGSASGWTPSLKKSEGSAITIGAYTVAQGGKYIWNYSIQG